MTAKRVYDVPTRLFHWLFAACFVIAFTISNTIDDDSKIFAYHMIAGLVMAFLVAWRILWGMVGTKHARFADLQLSPRMLVDYLKNIFSQRSRLWAGHNPASSWAAASMLLLAISMGVSGLLMVTGNGGENLEDIHELLANAFIIVVVLHIAGVVIHTLKHKDSIGKSMLTGHKLKLADNHAPVRNHLFTGIVLLLLTSGFISYLLANFDASSRNLAVFGTQIQLAEYEEHGESKHDDEHD